MDESGTLSHSAPSQPLQAQAASVRWQAATLYTPDTETNSAQNNESRERAEPALPTTNPVHHVVPA
jgi:hypothetical protein